MEKRNNQEDGYVVGDNTNHRLNVQAQVFFREVEWIISK